MEVTAMATCGYRISMHVIYENLGVLFNWNPTLMQEFIAEMQQDELFDELINKG